jgi:pyruvate dehydrogenase E2 component (dihydrolipoamide acetyltransferase)
MPKANENLTEATLDRWLVKEGDAVAKDGSLCDIITDKATFQMPAPCAGVVLKRLAPERSVLPVGYVMCLLGDAGETVSADWEQKNEALLVAHRAAATSVTPAASGGAAATGPSVSGGGVRATPAARRLAKEKGVDLAAVAKALNLSGPVNEKDILAYLEKKA